MACRRQRCATVPACLTLLRLSPYHCHRRACSLGITGHRNSNEAFARNQAGIEVALTVFLRARPGNLAGHREAWAPTRLHSLLAHGADLFAVERALERDWVVAAPLPFGRALNIAINAHPVDAADARALLGGGGPCHPEVAARAADMQRLTARTQCLELAEQDDDRDAPVPRHARCAGRRCRCCRLCRYRVGTRCRRRGRFIVEQSDLVIAIWDGVTPGTAGGTRHTIAAALDHGAPVIWIDAAIRRGASSCARPNRSPLPIRWPATPMLPR